MIDDRIANLCFHATDDEVAFTLEEADGNRLAFDRWNDRVDASRFGALALLESLVQSDVAHVSDDGLSVSIASEIVADFDDETASILHLPTNAPFILEISAKGALGTLVLEPRWVESSGLRVRDTSVIGVFLNVGERRYRLASPFFQILEQIDAFNKTGPTNPERQAGDWATIQELAGLERDHVKASQFLDRMRVARANRFTLDFVRDEDGTFQIAPVPLLAAAAVERDFSEANAQSETGAAEPRRLLTSVEQERFQRAFRGRSEVRSHYLGGNDVYVLLSPEVQRSLEVVREVQKKGQAERLAFARNPYPYLKADGVESDATFFESRSFSERVTGLGRIERVTLPWQILGSHGWLPPKTVPIDIGTAILDVPPDAIEPAIVDIEVAIGQKKSTSQIGDQSVPATIAIRDALIEARSALDLAATERPQIAQEERDESSSEDRIGLQIVRNLEDGVYASRKRERSTIPTDLPEIDATLKPHQVEAVRWLQRRWASGRRGALLADDMGLGKSLSALTFMMWLRSAMRSGRVPSGPMLIVAPVSLLENWQDEHAKHVGSSPHAFTDIKKAYGQGLPRKGAGRDVETGAAMLDVDELVADRFGKPTCVLTTYETLRDYQQSFASIHFALVVLDEAQRIKNPASLSWHAVSALHADFVVALTGTPVENRLADLWAIADAIEPAFLGGLRAFSARYEKDFDEDELRNLKVTLEQDPDGAQFMLRRLKEQVLEGIPPKHEHVHPLPMPAVQREAYEELVRSSRDVVAPKQILAVIQGLRDVSLNPLRPGECEPSAYVAASARFQSLFPLLDTIQKADEKALIFLDRNLVEAFLAKLIQNHFDLDELPPIINGTVPGWKRQQLVDQFQREGGFGVMILSPKAGGVGLTLTAANHVIHLSRWWNPAVEDQSTDRVYRIGQHKPVHVHYLQATLPIVKDSFDVRLHALLSKKRGLSRELLWPFESESTDAATLLGRDG